MSGYTGRPGLIILISAVALLGGSPAIAETISGGDTAWVLTSTALVLFMTIPGLSLFYAGLVRVKNVLSVLMQCFALTALMSLLWFVSWNITNKVSGMVPFVLSIDTFARKTFPRSPIHGPCSTPDEPNAKV